MSRLLVFAALAGDELLGCVGLIQQSVTGGDPVQVVVVTWDSTQSNHDERRVQAQAGLARLGAEPPIFWAEPVGELPLAGGILDRYRELVAAWLPHRIALPAPTAADADHRRLTRGLLASLTGTWRGELLFYETANPMGLVNHVQAIDIEAKVQALASCGSRFSPLNQLQYARGLAAVRGASIGVPAAEGYLLYEWDGSPQNFFDHRPLVSVIVRADDEFFLSSALESLCRQTYDHLEVVVVWHGADALPKVPLVLQQVVLRGSGPRSTNLNEGLAAATGDFVAFLDQDDVWEPMFVELLVTQLHTDQSLDIAYCDYRLVVCKRLDGETRILSTREPQGQDYRPGLLLIENFIPLNSFVCRMRVAKRIGFDVALQAYEDWDFLVRADMAGAQFHRVAYRASQYRLYPLEGEEADLLVVHRRKGYLASYPAMRQKVAAALTPVAARELLDLAVSLQSRLVTSEKQRILALESSAEMTRKLAAARSELDSAVRWAALVAPGQSAGTATSRIAGAALVSGPWIAIVLPVCDPDPVFLEQALESVFSQAYPRWQLCVADDASKHPSVLQVLARLEERASQDRRIRVTRRAARGGIVAATESASALADAPWLCFLDHDDRLDLEALLEVAAAIVRQPEAHALYTDSRTTDRNGVLLHSYSKPCWAPETLLHLNYINHLTVVRRSVYLEVGGLTAAAEGCQDWDLWLKLAQRPNLQVAHVARPLYDWRANEASVAYSGAAKPYILEAACRRVTASLVQRGFANVTCVPPTEGAGLCVNWTGLTQPLTLVVRAYSAPAHLVALVEQIAKHRHQGFKVLLVTEAAKRSSATTGLEELGRRPGVETLVVDRLAEVAATNNAALQHVTTPWLLFLDASVALGSIDNLVNFIRYLSLDSAIGAVGARLVHGRASSTTLLHDGIATDQNWVARNIVSTQDGRGVGIPRNVSAVAGVCLLTTRATFDLCGGFDDRLDGPLSAVDYCLAARRAGKRIVQASDIVVTYDSPPTEAGDPIAIRRAPDDAQMVLMRQKWGADLTERYRLDYQHNLVGTRILHIA